MVGIGDQQPPVGFDHDGDRPRRFEPPFDVLGNETSARLHARAKHRDASRAAISDKNPAVGSDRDVNRFAQLTSAEDCLDPAVIWEYYHHALRRTVGDKQQPTAVERHSGWGKE